MMMGITDKQKELRILSNMAIESGSYTGLLLFVKDNYAGCIAVHDSRERSFAILTKSNTHGMMNVPHLAKYLLPNIYRLQMQGRNAIVTIIKSRNGTIFAGDVLDALKLDKNGGYFVPSLAGNFVRLNDESTAFLRLKYDFGHVEKLP